MNASDGNKQELSPEQQNDLLKILKTRFENNMIRHERLEWASVQAKLADNINKLWSLSTMESTGGEPDVVSYDKENKEYIFYDCSAETPNGRRNICYDREALDARKELNQKIPLWICQMPWVSRFNRRTISRIAETWEFRSENIELVENT